MQTVYLAQFTLAKSNDSAEMGGYTRTARPRSGREAARLRLAGGVAPPAAVAGASVRDQVIRRTREWFDEVANAYGTTFPPTGTTTCTGNEQDHTPDGGSWRATFEHPQWPPTLATRNIRQCIEVEIRAETSDDRCTFSLRLEYDATSMLRERTPIEPPALVGDLVDAFLATSGDTRLTATPTLYDRAGVPELAALLTHPGRTVPVVVISKQADERPIVAPDLVARHLAGVAYVVELRDHDAAFTLSDLFTRQLSCYNGAVRVYWPGFSRDSEMYDHRLWLDQKLVTGDMAERMPDILLREIADHLPLDVPVAPVASASMSELAPAPTVASLPASLTAPITWGGSSEPTLADWLSPAKLQSLLAFPVAPVEPEPPVAALPPAVMPAPIAAPIPAIAPAIAPAVAPAVIVDISLPLPLPPVQPPVALPVATAPEVTTAATERHMSAEALLEAVERQFEGALAAQQSLLERLQERLGNFQIRLAMLEGDNREIRRENTALRERLGQLPPDANARLARSTTTVVSSEQASGAMDELWDAVYLAKEGNEGPHIVFLDAAYDAASHSPLRKEYLEKAYNYLLAICDVARRHHAGELDGGFREAFARYGIEYSSKISDTAATQHSDQYTFVWKKEDGTAETIMAGPHIGFGNGSDEKLLRIYWHWDKVDRRFVICHIGRHLSGKNT